MPKLRILKAKLELIKNKFMDIDTSVLKQHPEDKDEIWNMYEKSYKSIGMHLNKDTLFKYDEFILKDLDDDPFADIFVSITNTPHGKKLGIAGNDGSPEAIQTIKQAISTYLQMQGYYAELSLKTEFIAQKHGVPFIDNHELVEQVLGKSVDWEGDGYYSRQLGEMGNVSKRLYGFPKGVNQALLKASQRFQGAIKT